MEKQQYRHKIDIWRAGLEDFDEIVFLDWDCVPLAPIPDNFWEDMSLGRPIKSPLHMYKNKRAYTRIDHERKVSAATFVYMRGKKMAQGVIEAWEYFNCPFFEELALSKYIDDINGGWKGVDDYKIKFEPGYQVLFAYDKDYLSSVKGKNIFYHLNHKIVKGLLGDNDEIKARIDGFYKRIKK
jgi:hypothetical protein